MEIFKNPGWRTCIGGFLIHLVLGTLYCWGIFTAAVTAHLRKFDNTITYNETLMVYATALGGQGFTMLLGGMLENSIGARKTCLLGGYILVLGTFLSAISKSLVTIIVADGIMFGIGMGICYTAPIACSTRWLPKHKGLVTGIIVSGFGGGTFIFGQLGTRILFSGKAYDVSMTGGYYEADSSIAENVPLMFVVLGCCYFILISLGGFMICDYPSNSSASTAPKDEVSSHEITMNVIISSDNRADPVRSSIANTHTKSVLGATYQCAPTKDSHYDDEIDRSPAHSPGFESSHGLTEPDKSIPDGAFYSKTVAKSDMEEVADSSIAGTLGPMSLIRSPLAWHVAFCFVTTTVGGMYIAGTYKTYIQKSFGSSDERTTASNEAFISTVGTIAAIFNASGRMLWGAIADRAGNMATLMALSLVFAILLGTYSFSSALGRVGITLWTFGIFLCEGGNFALYMPLIVELFGSKFAGSNYGLIFTFYSLCNVITISVLAGENVDFLHATVITSSITLTGLFNLLLLRCHIQSYSTISQNIES